MGFSPEDVLMMQQRLARGRATTGEPIPEDAAGAGDEIESLHRPAIKWFTEQGIAFVYNRPDRASTATPGAPDIIAFPRDSVLLIEFKTREGKLSEAQRDWHFLAQRAGHEVHVIRSMAQFLTLVRQYD